MNVLKKLLIIVPVVCGIVLFAVMKTNKKAPVRLVDQERVQIVRVIPLEKMPVKPRVISYGYVEADRTWQAISEVSGKVVWVNENLKKGYFIKKGESLFKIDTTSYGLAETRGVADLMNIDARLKELEQSRTNTERPLAIEKKTLASAGQELKRKRELFAREYISASDLEREERNFLTHQTAVNNLQNTLDLIPSQEKALLAQKKSGESTVSEQRLDVARAEIRAPFNCRLSVVDIELHQFAAAGTVLVEAESVDRAEIPVSLTPKSLMTLLPRKYTGKVTQMPDMETIRRAIGISARVRLPMDTAFPIEWDGIFSRTSESMDLKTGALTLYGRRIDAAWVVPRSAVHDSSVYICDPDNRLEVRPVGVDFYMEDMAVVSQGLEPGETLVLSDLVPAIQGMRLKPVLAPDVLSALKQEALGEIK